MDKNKSVHFFHKLSGNHQYRTLIFILLVALIGGVGTGYALASNQSTAKSGNLIQLPNQTPKTAQQDARTFRDFAEGKITKKPENKAN